MFVQCFACLLMLCNHLLLAANMHVTQTMWSMSFPMPSHRELCVTHDLGGNSGNMSFAHCRNTAHSLKVVNKIRLPAFAKLLYMTCYNSFHCHVVQQERRQ